MMTKKGVAAALAGTVFLLGVSLLAFIPVFNGCTKSMCHIDLGLYYLKLIRWIQTFPIVPGLSGGGQKSSSRSTKMRFSSLLSF